MARFLAASIHSPPTIDSLCDGNLTHALTYLSLRDLQVASSATKRVHGLSSHDIIWRPLCEAHWKSFFRFRKWLGEAEESEKAAKAARVANSWKLQYQEKEQQRTMPLGIFAMRANLVIGRPFGLHWFEPRYRMLAARCVAGSRLMCYCTEYPNAGSEAFICEMPDAELMPDGRANVTLLPVAKCVLEETWEEPVPQDRRAPRLICARVRELPRGPAAAPAAIPAQLQVEPE